MLELRGDVEGRTVSWECWDAGVSLERWTPLALLLLRRGRWRARPESEHRWIWRCLGCRGPSGGIDCCSC